MELKTNVVKREYLVTATLENNGKVGYSFIVEAESDESAELLAQGKLQEGFVITSVKLYED